MVKLGLLIFNGCSFSLFKYILVSVEHASQYLITVCFGLKLLIMKHLEGRCAEPLGFSYLRVAVKTEAAFPLCLPGAAQWPFLLRAVGALCPVPIEAAAASQLCLVPMGSWKGAVTLLGFAQCLGCGGADGGPWPPAQCWAWLCPGPKPWLWGAGGPGRQLTVAHSVAVWPTEGSLHRKVMAFGSRKQLLVLNRSHSLQHLL